MGIVQQEFFQSNLHLVKFQLIAFKLISEGLERRSINQGNVVQVYAYFSSQFLHGMLLCVLIISSNYFCDGNKHKEMPIDCGNMHVRQTLFDLEKVLIKSNSPEILEYRNHGVFRYLLENSIYIGEKDMFLITGFIRFKTVVWVKK